MTRPHVVARDEIVFLRSYTSICLAVTPYRIDEVGRDALPSRACLSLLNLLLNLLLLLLLLKLELVVDVDVVDGQKVASVVAKGWLRFLLFLLCVSFRVGTLEEAVPWQKHTAADFAAFISRPKPVVVVGTFVHN